MDGRIRKLSNPMTLQGRLDRVATKAANLNVFAVLVGLRVLGKTPNLYSRNF